MTALSDGSDVDEVRQSITPWVAALAAGPLPSPTQVSRGGGPLPSPTRVSRGGALMCRADGGIKGVGSPGAEVSEQAVLV